MTPIGRLLGLYCVLDLIGVVSLRELGAVDDVAWGLLQVVLLAGWAVNSGIQVLNGGCLSLVALGARGGVVIVQGWLLFGGLCVGCVDDL